MRLSVIEQVKKSYVSYLYHKKQYLKAKKKEKLDLRLKGQTGKDPRDLFNQSSLFLHESHDLASVCFDECVESS